MEFEEERKILKHITLGTDEVFYYPYRNGKEPLPLRSISSFELDQCFYNALERSPTEIADIAIKLKLDIIKGDTEVNINNNGYRNFKEFYDTIDYWVVYHSMKDFQPDDFTKPDDDWELPRGMHVVRKMEEIHEIASMILDYSSKPNNVIKQFFKSDEGETLAMRIAYMNQPLGDIKDLTKLQQDFIVYSKGNIGKRIRGKSNLKKTIKSSEKYKIKDILKMV